MCFLVFLCVTYLTEANFGEGGVVGPEPLYEEDDAGHGLSQPVTSQSCIYIKANKANASAAKRSRQESAQILLQF